LSLPFSVTLYMGEDWSNMLQDKVQCGTLVNRVIKRGVAHKFGI